MRPVFCGGDDAETVEPAFEGEEEVGFGVFVDFDDFAGGLDEREGLDGVAGQAALVGLPGVPAAEREPADAGALRTAANDIDTAGGEGLVDVVPGLAWVSPWVRVR